MRDVTIIIPTMGVPERAPTIKRAVESILSQSDIDPYVNIVVNGNKYVPEALQPFEGNDRVTVTFTPRAHIAEARLLGRDMVETTYYGFLDDDDSFLPGGLGTRVDALEADPSLDAVVTNGYLERGAGTELIYDKFLHCPDDPELALIDINWLCSCGGLYRSATIGREIYTDMPPSMEMTLLAFRLAQRYKILRIDSPTFVLHFHDFERLSRTSHYRENLITVLRTIQEEATRTDIKRKLEEKIGRNHHQLAQYSLRQGQAGQAWRHHLKSLRTPGGWKYLSYTRHLILPRPAAP